MQYNSITSNKNSIVKHLVDIKSSSRARRTNGTMLFEGLRLCSDAVRCGAGVERLLISEESLSKYSEKLCDMLSTAKSVYTMSDSVASYLGDTNTTQGVFAEVCLPKTYGIDDIDENGLYFLLDTVQDPGNVGTILRTAEGFGFSGVILSGGCADVFSSKVIRASMGSVLRLPIFNNVDLKTIIASMRKNGMNVFFTRLDTHAKKINELDKSGGLGIVLGNEGCGVSEEVYNSCDGAVFIPMSSKIESFNVAISAGIVGWELRRI